MLDPHVLKQELLRRYLRRYQDLAPQGSLEWLRSRLDYIGGSEIDTLVNCSDLYTPAVSRLVANHVGLESFSGNAATKWGSLCEPVTKALAQNILCTTIHEAGSIVNERVPSHRYSMDGIGVVNFDADKISWLNLNGESDLENRDLTVMFEFKNVCSRNIDGKIPKKYLSQIQAGLDTIEIADLALYMETRLERISASQLKTDHWLDKNYVAHGLIGFYVFDQSTPKFGKYSDANLGNLDSTEFKTFLVELNLSPDVAIYYSPVNSVDEVEETRIDELRDEFFSFCSDFGARVVGFFPYVVTEMNMVPVERDPSFMSPELVKKMSLVTQLIRQCNKLKDAEDIKHVFCENFPTSKIAMDMNNGFDESELDLISCA